MDSLWTLPELVSEVATRIAALPPPKNGQVRAVPDERTVRYYVTLGLLDRPTAMRGRTALYGKKHAAQVVAIKRLQTMGRSLSEIQALWPTLDDATLARMSGVAIPVASSAPPRSEFWKREPVARDASAADHATAAEPAEDRRTMRDLGRIAGPAGAEPSATDPSKPSSKPPIEPPSTAPIELRIELAQGVVLSLAIGDEIAVSPADVRAIRAAAAPLLAELAARRLAPHPEGEPS
ncbi:MAG TPA: MerR family transcriptional regulator [Kofleriaceae bacterium]|nr:MerR family transcriptional regulator [Kofleriaceae bacterium]